MISMNPGESMGEYYKLSRPNFKKLTYEAESGYDIPCKNQPQTPKTKPETTAYTGLPKLS